MSIYLIPSNIPSQKLKNLDAFVSHLRHFTKSTIVNQGIELLWYIFKNKLQDNQGRYLVINGYGPKIIILALAIACEFNRKNLPSDGFPQLCYEYLGIQDTINNKKFLNLEANTIINKFSKNPKNKIPLKFLKFKYIKQSCAEFFIARTFKIQQESYLTNIKELFTVYKLLSTHDESHNNEVTLLCKKIYKIDLLHFFRSGFGLFAIGLNRNGDINFNNISCDTEVTKKFNINLDTCMLVASKICYDESKLRTEWYEKEVKKYGKFYQKYYPDPLFHHPIIHKDLKTKNIEYLLPSPIQFIRGFINSIFYNIIKNNSNFSADFGIIFEKYILMRLKNFFGEKKVIQIIDPGEKADFHISLEECDIIIETKLAIGSPQSLSVITPIDVVETWNRIYTACKQCSSSIKKFNNFSKPIITIILISAHISSEAGPFQAFAERSDLLNDLGIDCLEFLSWNQLEYTLSKTSIKNLISGILEKKKQRIGIQLGEIINLEIEQDTPTHNYEYLKESELKILGRNIIIGNKK